jgi:hypothetical protein
VADLEQRWRERRERSRRELGSWSVARVVVTLVGGAATASAVSAIIGQDTLGSISALAGVLGGLGLVLWDARRAHPDVVRRRGIEADVPWSLAAAACLGGTAILYDDERVIAWALVVAAVGLLLIAWSLERRPA